MTVPGAGVTNADTIAGAIAVDGWTSTDRWLPESVSMGLARQCRDVVTSGAAAVAGVGRGSRLQRRPDVRGDLVSWVGTDAGTSRPMRAFLAHTESLRRALNRQLQLGAFELEAHFAAYPPDTFYARHLDRFRDDDRRVVSLVHYFNEDWSPGDGGELRLFPDGVEAPFLEIAPIAGRSVFFLSERMHHEVRVTRRWRLSLTGWFRRR